MGALEDALSDPEVTGEGVEMNNKHSCVRVIHSAYSCCVLVWEITQQ